MAIKDIFDGLSIAGKLGRGEDVFFPSSDNPGLFGDLAQSVLGDKLYTSLDNYLTGDKDFERQKELMEKTQAFNSLESQKNRDWTDQQRATSYQTAVADMKAAGLNPALMYSSGSATPIGSSSPASVSTPSAGKSSQGIGQLINVITGLLTKGVSLGLQSVKEANKVKYEDIKLAQNATIFRERMDRYSR